MEQLKEIMKLWNAKIISSGEALVQITTCTAEEQQKMQAIRQIGFSIMDLSELIAREEAYKVQIRDGVECDVY